MESGVKTLLPSNPEKLAKRASPWGTPVPPQAPFSLAAVIDEELAKQLQTEEEEAVERCMEVETVPSLLAAGPGPEDTHDDYLLAQMLQLDYDKEHDHQLQAEEKHFNKHSTVHVSFEKYRSLHPYLEEERESSGESSDEGGDSPAEELPARGHRRSKGVAVGMVTKHDAVLCGRRNVKNMEKFPPDFPAGDLNEKGQDYRLSNAVFNTLKHYSRKEEKYAQKLHEKKEHSTHEQVLDQKTRLMLFKMVDGGVLAEVNGCISTGKESRIYHAQGGQSEEYTVPAECAVKIFKTTLNEFKNRDRYIKNDYRFKGRYGKANSRKLVELWAEKEMHNLKRLSAGGVRCPEVVMLKKHVLVMSFLGEDMKPAPQLREVKLTRSQLETAHKQCIEGMKRMYQECHLIHADLSEYNMLWFKGDIYFIDVGQSVEPSHPNGLEFLYRDCVNVSSFFSRAGLGDEAMSSQQLFNHVTDIGISADGDKEFVVQLQNLRQRERFSASTHSFENYPFDYFFEKTSGTSPEGPGEHSGTSPEGSSSEECDPLPTSPAEQMPTSPAEQMPTSPAEQLPTSPAEQMPTSDSAVQLDSDTERN